MGLRKYKPKEICDFYFTQESVTGGVGTFVCTCGISKKQKTASGYTNLQVHINTHHKNWYEEMQSVHLDMNNNLTKFLDRKSLNIFGWMEWVVMENREFNFTEKPLTNKYTKLERISTETFMKYLELLTAEVEKIIIGLLPNNFGVLFDGWSEGSTHYIALFATYTTEKKSITTVNTHLLAMAPLVSEDDFSATSHKEFITWVIESIYKKRVHCISFLCGDNCSTNKALATSMSIPLVGCASHRFNLAVQSYLKQYEQILNRVHELMKKLTTLKQAAKLRTRTTLRPVSRNATRWSSTFEMILRYFRIKDFIDTADRELANLVPSSLEILALEELMTHLKKFQSVTLKLQEEAITLHDVRILFDKLVIDYPAMETHLSSTANIVQSPSFESGVVKIIAGMEDTLDIFEKLHLRSYLLPASEDSLAVVTPETLSYAESTLNKAKSSKSDSLYQNLEFIPPTSNMVERLFSTAKSIITDDRKSMSPFHLECVLFLKQNRSLWDSTTVAAVVNKK